MYRQTIAASLSLLGVIAGALAVLTLVASAAAAASSSDWPGFRGPNGNGQVLSGLPAGDGELRLRVRWQRPLGSGYSGISVVGGVAVTATSSGERDLVLAFDPLTGAQRWTADLDALTVGVGGSKDGPISTPAIADGRVLMVSTQGELVALDLRSGERLWSVHLVDDLESVRPLYGFSTSPVVIGDLVVVQAGGPPGALVGLETSTGAVRWRAFRDRHYAQSPIVTELAGRRQLVAIGSTRVVGIDPINGQELWSHTHGGAGEFGPESSSPLPVGGDRLFVKHDNERSSVLRIAVQGDESLAVELLGENRTMTRSYSPPTVWGNQIYGYTSRFLSALDLETGKELWRSRAPGDGFPLAIEGLLFIVTKNEGSAHLGTASPAAWAELDRVTLFEDLVWTPPSYADGAFYTRSLTEMARLDVVRSQATTTDLETQPLPPELDAVRERIEQGQETLTAVEALLRDLDGPLIDGERVLFLWQGDAEEVGIAGDMFGFRYDEAMRRLEGTDLWWWQTELDRRGRFNYVFFPDYQPALDPLNPRTVESTAMGPDLNHRDETALQMSWFAMPDWPGNRTAAPSPPRDSESLQGAGGRLESFEVVVELPSQGRGPGRASGPQSVTVPVTVWLPPGYDEPGSDERYPAVFSLERYAYPIGDWPGTLDAVVGSRVAPLIGVLIDPPTGFYGRRGGGRVGLLMPEIVAEVDERYRTLAEPEHRAVVGALYTGPPALALAIGEDRLFARVAVQSPFAIDATLPMHREQLARASSAPRPTALYFEWAHWEMRSRLEGLELADYMRDLYEIFVDAGYDVIGGEVWDSTDWAGWRNRTDLVLEALFPSASGDAPTGLAGWLVERAD